MAILFKVRVLLLGMVIVWFAKANPSKFYYLASLARAFSAKGMRS